MAEAAGLVLAVIPLMIAAVENYDKITQPLLMFRGFDTEVRRLQRSLENYQGFFVGECRLLLADISKYDPSFSRELTIDLDELAQIEDIGLLQNPALNASVRKYLGPSLKTFYNSLEEVQENLSQLSKTIGKAVEGANIQSNYFSIGDPQWRARCAEKFRLIFQKNKIEIQMSQLHQLNDKLHSLLRTIRKENKYRHDVRSRITLKRNMALLKRYEDIQGASRGLYNALNGIKACPAHCEHAVSIAVRDGILLSSAERYKFDMAFISKPSEQCVPSMPVWIEVECQMMAQASCVGADRQLDDTSNNRKRARPTNDATPAKQVRFTETLPEVSSISPIATSHLSTTLVPRNPLVNLAITHDLCRRIQSECSSTWTEASLVKPSCIGFLECATLCKHLLYVQQGISPSLYKYMSLAELLQSLSEDHQRQRRVRTKDRYGLAKSLAIMFLQFHTTPWLSKSWRSTNVSLYGMDREVLQTGGRVQLDKPHVNVSLSPIISEARVLRSRCRFPGRNEPLFRLGVILLELAFQASLSSLRTEDDVQDAGKAPEMVDIYTARRLADKVAREMGSEYATIVRKCLDCDFGLGVHTFDNVDLLASFHDEVVGGLEKLELKLKDMRLDDALEA